MGCPPMIGDLHFHRRYSLRLQESKPLKNNGIISTRRARIAIRLIIRVVGVIAPGRIPPLVSGGV
jgi:hypothetical protein